MAQILDPLCPSDADARQAQESAAKLAKHLRASEGVRLHIHDEAGQGESVPIPAPALELLNEILVQMAAGNAVSVVPSHAEYTTQQAADYLSVSRPYVVGLLESGKIPFHRVGTHRRIYFGDLLQYRLDSDAASRRAFDELTAEAQDLGFY